jgi:hypothetical protein
VSRLKSMEPTAAVPMVTIQNSENAAVAGAASATAITPAVAADAGLTQDEAKTIQFKNPLPSRLPVLSIATQGRRVLAIDTRNAVFVSEDAGESWKAVQAQWQGRAVRAVFVALPTGNLVANSRDKEAFAVALQSSVSPSPPVVTGASALKGRLSSGVPGSGITGVVTDQTGAVISGASISVSDTATRTPRTIKTDKAGRFLVDGLPPGTYDVEAQAPGFEKRKLAAVAVAANSQSQANLTLTVGSATAAVEVDGAPTSLETVTVSSAATETIPLNGGAGGAIAGEMKGKRAAPMPPAAHFEINTDTGERWTSTDGVTWKRM